MRRVFLSMIVIGIMGAHSVLAVTLNDTFSTDPFATPKR